MLKSNVFASFFQKFAAVILVATVTFLFAACSKDKPTEPEVSSALVGTRWEWTDPSGESQTLNFISGTEVLITTYSYDEWDEKWSSVTTSATYTYNNGNITIRQSFFGVVFVVTGSVSENKMTLNDDGDIRVYTKI